jgi:hypothetical protein
MKNMRNNILTLALLTCSINVLSYDYHEHGFLANVVATPFVVTEDVVEGTGDVLTGQNPAEKHDERKEVKQYRAEKRRVEKEYRLNKIDKSARDMRIADLDRKIDQAKEASRRK